MNKPYIEFRKYTAEDLVTGVPKVFDNEFDDKARLTLFDPYGFLYPYGDVTQKPIFYVRHNNTDRTRFAAFLELGDDYLSTQSNATSKKIAQSDTPVTPYGRTSDNPISYGVGTEEPFSEFRVYEDYSTWKESDTLDVKAKPLLPFAIIDHKGIFPNVSQIQQPSLISGFFEGKPVIGMGNYDRVYMPQSNTKDFGDYLAYIVAYGHGIREDGRVETYGISIHENGSSFGYYWIEGEEPFYVTEVTMETEWEYLPYVDDGTLGYKEATFKIGHKEIHFTGEWGMKGLTAHPRYERHGQSNIAGTWYEGHKPYKHKMSFTFNENMEAYDHKIEKFGFKKPEK